MGEGRMGRSSIVYPPSFLISDPPLWLRAFVAMSRF